MMPSPLPTRLPLGRSSRRQPYERRVRLWLAGLSLPTLVLTYAALRETPAIAVGVTVMVGLAEAVAASVFFEQLVRPLQTLSNVVAALREDDFSFRARGAQRGDSLGDLALEINALAGTLQQQRTAANDALTLVERVLTSMQSPVLAFDNDGRLRLLNAAARQTFSLPAGAIGTVIPELDELLTTADQALYPVQPSGAAARWSVRRAAFRLNGVPHVLLVLTDVAQALRDEERLAWQRLIRVLGHEINNSLTPIKSIAGSLRSRLHAQAAPDPDFVRGLAVIEDRSASLNRFLQAYQQLSRLPAPRPQPVSLGRLVAQVAALEMRLPVEVRAGAEVEVLCDADQIQQALINLLQNAADAALGPDATLAPAVSMEWEAAGGEVAIRVIDSGPGVHNPGNLFVPFYTTKPHGSGIGLVLAQQIASAHHGSITLETAAGMQGCTATLLLPLGWAA